MKIWLLSLWAWIASDPLYALVTAGVTIVLVWKALPARLRDAAEKRSPRVVGAIRTLVALLPDVIGAARIVRYQAVGGQPRSVVSDRAAAQADKLRELTKPSDPPPASPGFAEATLLAVIAGVSLVALLGALLTGCPMPAPDGCTPFATRCSPSGIPETCSQSQRWSHAPPATPCSSRGPVVCCWTRSPYGRELHACVPESACLPETGDAGVEVSDAR